MKEAADHPPLCRLLGAPRRRPAAFFAATMLVVVTAATVAFVFGLEVPGVAFALSLVGRPVSGDANFGENVYEETTLAGARSRMPFHVLQPSELPAGYDLLSVAEPRDGTSSHLRLTYRHHTAPVRDLIIAEAFASSRAEQSMMLSRGIGQPTTIDGHPAVYFGGLLTASGKPSGGGARLDPIGNGVTLERGGIVIQVFGWRDAGVDRTMLERIIASLR